MENDNNKGKVNSGLIFLLVLVILGLIGYIVYDKVLSNKEEDNNKITSSENQKALNDYIGLWYLSEEEYKNSANPNSLSVKSVDNNKVSIKLYITRISDFNFDVEINENEGTFEAKPDNGESTINQPQTINGKIILLNNKIKLTINYSNVKGLESGAEFEFTYHTDKDSSTYNKEYFDELLSVFLPKNSASNFMKNILSFTDEDITNYLFFYYTNYANKNNLGKHEENNVNITYNVSKSDIDALVYKVFGKKTTEFNITESKGRDGIRKIDENTYQVFWFATGWYSPDSKLTNLIKLDNEAIVEYELTGNGAYGEDGKVIGTLKFYLTKNDENWNVIKIEYIEK